LRWVRNEKGEIKTEVSEIQQGEQKFNIRKPVLEIFSPTSVSQMEAGTVKGGSATCPLTGFTTSSARVKEQLKQQRGGAQHSRLYAVYAERGDGDREFRIATANDFSAFQMATEDARHVLLKNPVAFPAEPINSIRPHKNTRGLSAVTRIGCASFSDLYNQRQLLSIYVFYEALKKINQLKCKLEPDFLNAVKTALAFAINRVVSQNTSMSRWDASRLTIKGAFSKQALAVVWDFAEANPFSGGSADWDGAVEWVLKFIEATCGIELPGTIVQASAMDIPLPSDSAAALLTDPPYFAAIPYADLSDFFYIWFKRGLARMYPEFFASDLTEKTDELIVTNAQKGRDGRTKDESFFRIGMSVALQSARDVVQPQGVGVVVYAEGTAAGWEGILGAIIDSNWIVTSSWPIDTEMENRTQAQGSASLQSSIHIVCRPRENPDGSVRTDEIGDWRDVLQELPRRMHEWMPRLAEAGVVGADAIFACLGPALEIYFRYASVEKASGDKVSLKEYLEEVWAAVAREALSVIFEGADVSGFEADARLTAMWLWTLRTLGHGAVV
jgi:putative DNA methylase